MRPILAISRFTLSASLGYAVVWAFSDPTPAWMDQPLREPARIDLADWRLPGAVSGLRLDSSAQAALPAGEQPAPAAVTQARVPPPFRGLGAADTSIAFARELEPLRLEAAEDADGAWVVGYGHRLAERPAAAITAEQAEALLRDDVTRAEAAVRASVAIPLNANEYVALVEFARSIGPENFQHTLVSALLNAGDREAAADAFMIWTKVRVEGALVDSPELVAQRRRARDLFLSTAASGA